MGYDTTIAQRLRDEGLIVVECAGWQTRGSSSFTPRGSVNHHTADGPNGATPSLDGIINGFSGSAPGPLANVMQSREPDGNDKFYVVAAGRANHAGEGGWRGLSGNSSVYGLEVEHTGTSALPEGRIQLSARFHAALARGRYDVSMICQHYEWAPSRKIDVATNVPGDDFRNRVANVIAGGTTPQPKPEEVEMWVVDGVVPPGTSRDNVGLLVLPLPVGRKSGRLSMYCPGSGGVSLWAAQCLNGKKFGLWSGGNVWEQYLTAQKPFAVDVLAEAYALEFHHMGGTTMGLSVAVSGT